MGKIKYILLTLLFLSGITYGQTSSPVLIEPPNGSNVVGTGGFTLDWSDVPSATCYFIDITTDTLTGPIFIEDSCNAIQSQYDIGATVLEPNTVYYWRVKAKFGEVYGTYSFYFSFRTSGTPQLEIDRVQNEITSMISSQLIPDNQGNILINRLGSSSHQLDLGNNSVAELFIYLYEDRVSILSASNEISTSTGNILTEEGDYILAVIRNLGNQNPLGQKVPDFNPKQYSISQNYPNPFNPTTTIEYSVPKNDFVSLKVYNSLGQEVKTLVGEQKDAGTYIVNFNAGDFSSGVYFYKLNAGTFTETKRMILTK